MQQAARDDSTVSVCLSVCQLTDAVGRCPAVLWVTVDSASSTEGSDPASIWPLIDALNLVARRLYVAGADSGAI